MKKEITKLQKDFKAYVEEFLERLYECDLIPTEKEYRRMVNDELEEFNFGRKGSYTFDYYIINNKEWNCTICCEDTMSSVFITFRDGDVKASINGTIFLDIPVSKKLRSVKLLNEIVYNIIMAQNRNRLSKSKEALENLTQSLPEKKK